jgi:limonene-1,2-epoxide hydrolase
VTIRRVLVDGNVGAVEWIWNEVDPATNQRRTTEDAIVFELCEGKVIYWREYFDPAQTQAV